MQKKMIISMLSFSLFIMIIECGCSSIPEPDFLTKVPSKCMASNEKEQIKDKNLSDQSAGLGWSYLADYFNKTSFVEAVNESNLAYAMRDFNYCWSFNSENYQAYWGAGVVRGVQATLTDDYTLAEKYLQQSVEFMQMAMKHQVPDSQLNHLRLDMANAYNGLGAFYRQQGKKALSATNLDQAQTLLRQVIEKDPENGRAYYLLAATAFYQERYPEAERLAKLAQKKHFKVPDDFLQDIAGKLKDNNRNITTAKE